MAAPSAPNGSSVFRLGRLLPFIVFVLLVFVALALMPFETRLENLVLPFTITLVLFVAVGLLPWNRLPSWLQAVPVLAFFVVIVLLRGVSQSASGLDPLVLLPVLWFALYGSLLELALAGVGTFIVLFAPLAVPGMLGAAGTGPEPGDVVRAVAWLAAVALLGPIVHAVVRKWRAKERESEARFETIVQSELEQRLLLEQLPDTVLLVVDDDLRYQLARGAGLVFQGALDWQGKTLYETSNSTNTAILEKAYRLALAGTRSVVSVSSTMTQRETEVTSIPLSQGDHPRALIVARDVTAVRGREMALRLATERFSELIRESPTGFALADSDGRLALVNEAFNELFESDGDDLIDTSATELLAAVSPSSDDWLGDLIASETGRLTAHITLQPSAEVKHAVVSAVVLYDDAEAPTSVLINVYDTTEQHRYHEHIAFLASHDALTGLVNRTEFELRLTAQLALARPDSPGAVLVLDLDNFREINDSRGHAAGDALIVAFATMLTRWVRSTDLVARIGGDEFAVLLADGDRAHAEATAKTLVALVRDGMQNRQQRDDEGPGHRVTVSVGVVAVSADSSAAELLSAADLAMYDAKNAGRNGHRFFDSSEALAARVQSSTNWTEKILAAVETDRLVLFAQPILDLETDTIASLELLVRMVDDDGSLIPPAEFVAFAENSGLAVTLDEWVVSHAIDHLAELQSIQPTIKVHVNLSGRSVGDLDFAAFIEKRLADAAVDATGLVLELTETAAVTSIDLAQTFMQRLVALGCVFALDDFGVGYGSFYYLKHLPFGIVKLDGEFVAGRADGALDRLVLSSLVSISKGLGMLTVAEFVEDEETLTLLRASGVDGAQGYHIGRPAPLDELFPVR